MRTRAPNLPGLVRPGSAPRVPTIAGSWATSFSRTSWYVRHPHQMRWFWSSFRARMMQGPISLAGIAPRSIDRPRSGSEAPRQPAVTGCWPAKWLRSARKRPPFYSSGSATRLAPRRSSRIRKGKSFSSRPESASIRPNQTSRPGGWERGKPTCRLDAIPTALPAGLGIPLARADTSPIRRWIGGNSGSTKFTRGAATNVNTTTQREHDRTILDMPRIRRSGPSSRIQNKGDVPVSVEFEN